MIDFILNKKTIGNALKAMVETPLDGTMGVEFVHLEDSRRLEQNALYWMWMADIAKHRGHGQDEVHEWTKEHILAPLILERPIGKYQKLWSGLVADLRRAIDGMPPWEARNLESQTLRLCSTTWCNVKQFTELLNRIEQHMQSHSMRYRHPDDI